MSPILFVSPVNPVTWNSSRKASCLVPRRTSTLRRGRYSSPVCTQTIKPPTITRARSKSSKTFRRPTAAPKLVVEGDSIESTLSQKALLAGFLGTSTLETLRTILSIDSASNAAWHLLAVIASYLFTDFAVGVYHHAVDNYGSEKTPFFGYQIGAFQGHHKFPWTITARDLPNNLYRLTIPLLPQLITLLFIPATPVTTFYYNFLCFIVLSQETHRQAHMSRPAPWVKKLQNVGLIVSQKAHMKHHLPSGSFEGNYCILSGIWNSPLDRGFFRAWEAIIFRATGVEPICWQLDPSLKKHALGLVEETAS